MRKRRPLTFPPTVVFLKIYPCAVRAVLLVLGGNKFCFPLTSLIPHLLLEKGLRRHNENLIYTPHTSLETREDGILLSQPFVSPGELGLECRASLPSVFPPSQRLELPVLMPLFFAPHVSTHTIRLASKSPLMISLLSPSFAIFFVVLIPFLAPFYPFGKSSRNSDMLSNVSYPLNLSPFRVGFPRAVPVDL